jgi:uncharacterized delta-60 repeat protein
MKKTLLFNALLGGLAMGLVHHAAYAQTGPLDPAFGTAGQVRTSVTAAPSADVARDVAVQPDGKIVVLGDGQGGTELVRYLPDGTLDATFGTGGKSTSRLVPSASSALYCLGTNRSKKPQALSLLQQPDGKLVVAGAVLDTTLFGGQALAWMVSRYLPNGQLDTSFGPSGKPYAKCGNSTGGSAYKVVRQSSGRLVVLGTDTGLNSRSTSAVGLTADGVPDNAFPNTYLGTNVNFYVTDAVVDAMDRIWVVGTSSYMPSTGGNWTYQRLGLYRLLANGQLDTSFGTNGEVLLNVNGRFTTGKSIALLPTGNVVVLGAAQANVNSSAYLPFLASYSATGTLDPAFGTAGVAVVQQPTLNASDLAVQSDGKLLVTATDYTTSNRYTSALLRWLPSGQLDTSYGLNGMVLVRENTLAALALQPDDKAVAVGGPGTSNAALGMQFSTIRVLPTANCTQVDAGGSQTVCLGSTRTFKLGNVSNPTSGLTYSWTVSPAISGFAASTGNPTVTLPNVTTPTTYVFSLSATSATSCTPTDQMQLVVVPDIATTMQPTASPNLINGGQMVTLRVTNPLAGATYAWSGPGLQTTTGTTVTAVPPADNNSVRYTVTGTLGTCTSSAGVQVGVRVPGTPAWSWATAQLSRQLSRPESIVTDAGGNAYVAGWFYDSTFINTPFRLRGNRRPNIYVAKYGPTGSILWTKRYNSLTTTGDGAVLAIGANGIYLAGSFTDSIRLGNTPQLKASNGSSFLARLTAAGDVVWARNMPFPTNQPITNIWASSMRADAQDNIYLGGQYTSTTSSYTQGCVAKLDGASGALIWFQGLTGPAGSGVSSIDLDGLGNIAIAGGGTGPFAFGTLTVAATGSTNFVGRLDAQQGMPQWLRPVLSGTSSLGGATTQVATNAAGDVFMTCTSSASSVTFAGATTAADLTVARSGRVGDGEVFMARYSATGTPVWAQRAGSQPSAISYSRGLQIRGGAVYLAGYFSGSINFGAVTLLAPSLYTGFIAKYAAATGANEWAQQSGSGNTVPAAEGLAVDALGNCWLSGTYIGIYNGVQGAGFGANWLPHTAPFSGPSEQGFLARLGTSVGLATSVARNSSGAALNLYPNPVHGTPLYLELTGSATVGGPVQVTLLSSLGQRVYEVTLANSTPAAKLSIPTQQLAPGMYLVRVRTALGTHFGKVQVN